MKIFKFLTCVAFVATLVGCKSEIVETKVKTSDIKKKHFWRNDNRALYCGAAGFG